MTKNNKQPRDDNGKFAKTPMFTLHSNDGSTAFFKSFEDLEKFAKNNNIAFKEKSKSAKNPDCEPATKGYVKNLMRKTREHTHITTGDGSPIIMSVIFGWLFTIAFGISALSKNTEAYEIGNKYFVPFLLFSIAVSCILYEIMKIESKEIREPIPRELYRYTPPRKDECEEE